MNSDEEAAARLPAVLVTVTNAFLAQRLMELSVSTRGTGWSPNVRRAYLQEAAERLRANDGPLDERVEHCGKDPIGVSETYCRIVKEGAGAYRMRSKEEAEPWRERGYAVQQVTITTVDL